MIISLEGKRALVCGGSDGIGLAIAAGLAKAGACITLMARNEEKLRGVINNLGANALGHDYVVADFLSEDSIKQAISQLAATGRAYHILVNNTGGPAAGPLTLANESELLLAFQTHLLNNHRLMQAVVPGMKSEGYGRIINVVSTSVKVPLPGLGVSNTIRGSVGNWSKTLATELAPFGITVNNVLPGATLTGRLSSIIENKAAKTGKNVSEIAQEMLHEIPMGRFGEPEEVAASAVFLASPQAAYVTGTNLVVDGGRTGCL